MHVKLIQRPLNPIDTMWTAARTCYSSIVPTELWFDSANKTKEDKLKLVRAILSSGHESIAEHVYFTFCIEGISRACSHQLVRHRAGIVFSQQSQRYVEIKEDISIFEGTHYDKDNYLENTKVIEALDKYFVWDKNNYAQFHSLCNALYSYLYQVRDGVAPEDARAVLPNATKTNIVMSINLRELIHISELRLCQRAQTEIRDLFKAIKKEVELFHIGDDVNAGVREYVAENYYIQVVSSRDFVKKQRAVGLNQN